MPAWRKNPLKMEFEVFDLGLVDFQQALDFQKEKFNAVKSGSSGSALILCRHYPVITYGRRADRKNILAPPEILKQKGIRVYEVERGGDVTYHGPGQLVAYPVFDLHYFKKDIHLFLRRLEDAVMDLLSDFGICAVRISGKTGVWVGKEKISSVGVAIRNWVTFHGVSINIARFDMDNFRLIRPCNMDVRMACLEDLLGRNVDIDEIKEKIAVKFKANFMNAEALWQPK